MFIGNYCVVVQNKVLAKHSTFIFAANKHYLKRFCAIAFFLVIGIVLFAQTDTTVRKKQDTPVAVKPKPVAKPVIPKPAVTDSLKIKDSIAAVALTDSLKQDSLKKAVVVPVKPAQPKKDTSSYAAIMYHAFIPFNKTPVFEMQQERKVDSNDALFYLLAGVVALVAFIRISFPKYFQNLFSLFFQTSFRQKQTRDQLLQDNLASLLMNLLFVISGSIFITLIAQRQHWLHIGFWWLLLYCSILLAAIYLVKYLFLLFSGWVFNAKEAANTYLFIIFLINKIIGIVLIPFLLVLAFSATPLVQVAVTVALIVVAVMFLYRYVVSLGTIRTTLKVNALHFFLYLCAIEILPLLLMYKVLFNFVEYHP